MSPASYFAYADILKVLDSLPVGLLMVSQNGRVLHMNQALATLTGFEAGRVKGAPCRHVLRGRPCVAGCTLGCGAFGGANKAGANQPGIALENLPLAGLSDGVPGVRGMESDILTLKKRKVPVRLTHFPVLDASGVELFRLDVVEDLTELKMLEHRLHQAHGHGRLVGRSAAMERIAALIPSVAPSAAPIFISGETGTGKDILAETLHQASQRSREPFIRLNISPMPEELLLPDIFGQSGPDVPERPGRFQQASGGTLYISEIADIPRGIQSRLVQYLDSGGIVPVGALRETLPDVRLITATNRNPDELLQQGLLSADLYHRLNVVRLNLPPLRERREDIDFLLSHFLDLFGARFKKDFTGFTPQARALLATYDYPGNVRELRNIVEYAAMVGAGGHIGIESLPAHLAQFGNVAPKGAPRKNGRKA
ncbi:sigma 54-interacting transcriptional regulator [Desulfovibrio sp. OttesenSCG-928-F20]|nr:sigma 54-interacting transcriptional regulator [Desulfovibrio sp. OttesenSCG-928-F20]